MSLHGAEAAPQRLLPETMDERLRRWLNKVLGLCLLALAIVGWMALLLWSERDGVSLRNGGMPLNPMGNSAAKVADSLLQALGLAAGLVMLPIAAAGLRLLTDRSSAGWKHRLVVASASLALVSLGLSAIPTPASWALSYGLGGLIGDTLVTVLTPLTILLGADNAMQAITVFGLVIGTLGTLRSLEIDPLVLVGLRPGTAPATAPPDYQARARANWRSRAGPPSLEMPPPNRPVHAPSPPHMSDRLPEAIASAGPSNSTRPGLLPPAPATAAIRSPMDGTRQERSPDGRADRWPPPAADAAPRAADQTVAHRGQAGASLRPGPVMPGGYSATASPERSSMAGPSRAQHGPPSALPLHRDDDVTGDPVARRIAERFANVAKSEEGTSGEGAGRGVMGRTHQWLRGLRPRGVAASRDTVRERPRYIPPGIDLLRWTGVAVRSPEFSDTALAETGRQLVSVLSEFGVAGRVTRIAPGPVVTRFELLPAEGIKLARVVGLADDLARALSVPALRVTGAADRTTLAIELPNVRREAIAVRDLIDAEPFRSGGGTLPLALGKSSTGMPVVIDLARLPNLLIAGAPRSGVAGVVDAAILSLLFKLGPEDCRLLLIAGNPEHARALAAWENVPHVLAPVLTEPGLARAALDWLAREMEERARRLSAMQVKSIDAYNHRAGAAREKGEPLIRRLPTGFDASGAQVFETETRDPSPIPRIVPIILDPAALFRAEPDSCRILEHCLGRTARDTGVHMIAGIESASFAEPDEVTSLLLRLVPARAVLAVSGRREGRAVIGEAGAEHLLGHGDMLLATGGASIERVHGADPDRGDIDAVSSSIAHQRVSATDLGLGAALALTKLAGEVPLVAMGPAPPRYHAA